MDRTWDDEAADKLVGKRVHLAVTYADAWGHLIREAQFCGRVVTADRAVGIDLELDGGDGFRLPPDLSNFEWAYPGEYRDDVTGELVDDPDLRVSWEIAAPVEPPSDFWRRFGRRKGKGTAA